MSDGLDDGMTDDGAGGQDNDLIRSLRSQLSDAKAELKAERKAREEALVEARTTLDREATAKRLVDHAGYPGLAEVVLERVEGEITPDKVFATLDGMSLTVDREAFNAKVSGKATDSQPAQSQAKDLASVTSLGSQVSAAAQNTRESTVAQRLAEADSLEAVIAAAQEGGFYDPM